MQIFKSALLAIVLLFGSGFACAKRVDVPGQTATSSQSDLKVHQALASMAALNETSINTVALLGKEKRIDPDTERTIYGYNTQVIAVHRTALSVMHNGKPWAERSQEVLTLLRALTLPDNIKALLNRPQNDTTLAVLVNVIQLLQSEVRKGIQGAQQGAQQ